MFLHNEAFDVPLEKVELILYHFHLSTFGVRYEIDDSKFVFVENGFQRGCLDGNLSTVIVMQRAQHEVARITGEGNRVRTVGDGGSLNRKLAVIEFPVLLERRQNFRIKFDDDM